MDYDKTNAESILHVKGRVAVVVHKTFLDREEKDTLRAAISDPSCDVVQLGKNFYGLLIDEEPDAGEFPEPQVHVPDPDHVCDDNDDCEFHEYQGPKPVEVVEAAKFSGTVSDEPSMDELRALTVQELKNLADKDRVDLSGLKLKDDILGRMAAHFGLDPAS